MSWRQELTLLATVALDREFHRHAGIGGETIIAETLLTRHPLVEACGRLGDGVNLEACEQESRGHRRKPS